MIIKILIGIVIYFILLIGICIFFKGATKVEKEYQERKEREKRMKKIQKN